MASADDAADDSEYARLQALHRHNILDTETEPAFERIVQIVQAIADVPVAMINFLDEERRWCKACTGHPAREIPRELSFCHHAVAANERLHVPDTCTDARFQAHPLVVEPPHMRFYLGVPLRAEDGYAIGTLCLIDQVPRQLTERQVTAVANLAVVVERELALRQLAYVDPLTGAFNRRLFFDLVEQENARARRTGGHVSIAWFDLDQFKAVNDQYGHEIGDSVLAAVTRTCQQTIRQEDTLFRMGGDEFLVLFAESTADFAENAGERLRNAISAIELKRLPREFQPSCSVGIVKSASTHQNLATLLLNTADRALYEAKNAGGNRIVVEELVDPDQLPSDPDR